MDLVFLHVKEIVSWRQEFLEAGVAGKLLAGSYYAECLQQSAQLAPNGADSTGEEVVHAEAGEKESAR